MIPDTIDLSAYLGDGDFKARVRPASAFVDEVIESFAPTSDRRSQPEMFSTKLRGRLEFRPGEVTAWSGYNGHRKSMFTGQVALDLCVQRERVLVVSLEMQPRRTFARMAQQASGTAMPHPEQVRVLSQWSDGRLWMFDHLGRITPEQAIAVCRYFAEEHKGTQIFLDSMMMVCSSEESLDEQKNFMTDVVRFAKESSTHVHLITHCRKPQTTHSGEERRPTKWDLRGSAAVSDQADNVVMVWANKAKLHALEENPADEKALQQPDQGIYVDKQRNGSFEGGVQLWWHAPSMRFVNDRVSLVEPYAFLGGRA